MLAAGRFAAEADELRAFRRIATLDPTAPLPDLPDRRARLGGRGTAQPTTLGVRTARRAPAGG